MSSNDRSPRRVELEARLAAERANILFQLRGLNESDLFALPVSDGWTPKDFLPHLGYWDAVYSQRMALVLDGRRREIEWIDGPEELDTLNEQVYEQFASTSVGEALAISLKERNAFMATLSKVPDDLLFQRIQLRPGWRTSLATWTRQRFLHDGQHATELAQWRTSLDDSAFFTSPSSKLLLRPILQASRQEFMILAALVKAADRDSYAICGDWTLKDVLGHIAVYERLAATALQQLAAGQSPVFELTIRDFTAFNEAQVVARRGAPWEKVLGEFRMVRGAIIRLLDSVSDQALFMTFDAPWGSPINGYLYLLGLVSHEQEHSDFLRAEFGLRPLPKRLSENRPN